VAGEDPDAGYRGRSGPGSQHARALLDGLKERGWQVNVSSVPDLEVLPRSGLLLPASVTVGFNFLERGYRGRGSGAGGALHRYRGE
jgi:hypothetical protein